MKIQTWVDAYSVSLGNKTLYEKRIKELNSWDKPLNPKGNDPYGKWSEWATKIEALEYLLSQ